MKISFRQKMTGLVSAFVLIAGMAFIPGGHASALTDVEDYAYEGNGQCLSYTSQAAGTTVHFISGGSNDCAWQAELKETISGANYYYWHPFGNTGICLTASTTSKGVLKLEACDGLVDQQMWYNPHSGTYYHLESQYYNNECLYEPGGMTGSGTGFTTSCSYGDNGETFEQISGM
jgi:hypothetical protein